MLVIIRNWSQLVSNLRKTSVDRRYLIVALGKKSTTLAKTIFRHLAAAIRFVAGFSVDQRLPALWNRPGDLCGPGLATALYNSALSEGDNIFETKPPTTAFLARRKTCIPIFRDGVAIAQKLHADLGFRDPVRIVRQAVDIVICKTAHVHKSIQKRATENMALLN